MFGLISLQHLANIIPFLLIIYKNILSRGKNIVPLHTDYVQINILIGKSIAFLAERLVPENLFKTY